mmetsp:Transcript_682/g.826  ORF Transcript_682/g.826 Transcript_682/m.826 type:complete len:233 (-) Transcript_682:126-824(-)
MLGLPRDFMEKRWSSVWELVRDPARDEAVDDEHANGIVDPPSLSTAALLDWISETADENALFDFLACLSNAGLLFVGLRLPTASAREAALAAAAAATRAASTAARRRSSRVMPGLDFEEDSSKDGVNKGPECARFRFCFSSGLFFCSLSTASFSISFRFAPLPPSFSFDFKLRFSHPSSPFVPAPSLPLKPSPPNASFSSSSPTSIAATRAMASAVSAASTAALASAIAFSL